jgi:hypothetical protein
MAKLKIGDIVEIPTSKGFSYAQYSHKHKQYGALLRVFWGSYNVRPCEFDEVVHGGVRFMCFFPLSAAIDMGIFSVVGNFPLSEDAKKFPIFRAGVVDPATGKVGVWWLWDGEREWPISELTAEQRKLSIRGVWNDTILVERIESGWTPEGEET